ncbi:MAG: hypothetical protein OHK0046_44220 [Anaerolineae bacterium]
MLDYIVYGKSAGVLAFSSGLTADDATLWRKAVSVEPMNTTEDAAVGLFKGPEGAFLLARAYNVTESGPVYQYVRLARETLTRMNGNLRWLVESTARPTPQTTQIEPAEALILPEDAPLSTSEQIARLRDLPPHVTDVEMLITLLQAALEDRHLLICGYQAELNARLQLMEALLVLLPSVAHPDLTFSTNAADLDNARALVIFSDKSPESGTRWVWQAGESFEPEGLPPLPYTDYLRACTDLEALAAAPHGLHMPHTSGGLLTTLNHAVERYALDERVRRGAAVEAEVLKDVLRAEDAPQGELLMRYIERLLAYCLQEHDTDSVHIITDYTEEFPEIEAAVYGELGEQLEQEPDAVYFFLRTRMAEAFNVGLLPMLHAAAEAALQLAIREGDNDTLMTWFRLIAREPVNYDLSDVLREGLIAVQPRLRKDDSLGNTLLVFTAKRRPDFIDRFLADETILAVLNPPFGPALRNYDPPSVAAAVETGREMALVVLARTVEDMANNPNAVASLTPAMVDYLWSIRDASTAMPIRYQPERIITRLIENIALLPSATVQALLAQVLVTLNDNEHHTFREIATRLPEGDNLPQFLINASQTGRLPNEELIELVGQLVEDNTLLNAQVVDIYLRVSANQGWKATTLPLIEQVTRLLQKYPDLTVPLDLLWRLLQIAHDTQNETIVRVLNRRALNYIGQLSSETEFVAALLQLNELLRWSAAAHTTMINWCRDHVRNLSIARLQSLDKALDGQKALAEIRAITQTTIAVRKLLGKRSLAEFAEDVNTTFTVLQAFSDSFDPTNKQALRFDQPTVRAEIEAIDSDVTPDARSILAKNLKELAQVIIGMSEHRSKASLMRREEDIERQIIAGEQSPQSAIDTMKWLSGYLNGTQTDDGE